MNHHLGAMAAIGLLVVISAVLAIYLLHQFSGMPLPWEGK